MWRLTGSVLGHGCLDGSEHAKSFCVWPSLDHSKCNRAPSASFVSVGWPVNRKARRPASGRQLNPNLQNQGSDQASAESLLRAKRLSYGPPPSERKVPSCKHSVSFSP